MNKILRLNSIMKILMFFLHLISISETSFAQNVDDSQEKLAFPPDSVYNYISKTTESLVSPEEIPENVSVSEWIQDLENLENLIRNETPYADELIDAKMLSKQITDFKNKLPNMSRDQRILELFRIINFSSPGTGHFRIFGSQRAFGWKALPFYLNRFHDGTYIMSALDKSLIGKEIITINNTPIDSVYKKLSPYVTADNQWSRETHVQERILRWANPLEALGIIEDIKDFTIGVISGSNKVENIKVRSLPVQSDSYVRFLTVPGHRPKTPENLQWSPASVQENNPEPFYRTKYIDSLDMIYLQINILVSEDRVPRYSNQNVKELADSLAHIADRKPLKKFVIDLRTNEGGNTRDGDPLIKMIKNHPKINKRGTLYTLISPITNSAAGLFSMKLEQQTKTIFAGQNGGFSPNIWGEISGKILPNTKIMVYLSFAYYQGGFPNIDRHFIQPEINIPFTSDQHFNNDDHTLKAVVEHKPAPVQPIYQDMNYHNIEGDYKMSPIHRVEITNQKGLHLVIDRGEKETFVDTDIYPITECYFSTDVKDLFLKYHKEEAKLELIMKGHSFKLRPIDDKFILPLEYLRNGELENGKKAMFEAIDKGILLGNDFVEYPLTNFLNGDKLPHWPDDLSKKEIAKRALPYTTLSTELAPASWRTYANLALLHKELGNQDKVKKLARKILKLNVSSVEFIKNNLELDPKNLR